MWTLASSTRPRSAPSRSDAAGGSTRFSYASTRSDAAPRRLQQGAAGRPLAWMAGIELAQPRFAALPPLAMKWIGGGDPEALSGLPRGDELNYLLQRRLVADEGILLSAPLAGCLGGEGLVDETAAFVTGRERRTPPPSRCCVPALAFGTRRSSPTQTRRAGPLAARVHRSAHAHLSVPALA